MAAETDDLGLLIDGERYPLPQIMSFDLDEAELLFDKSGLTLEDFITAEDSEGLEKLLGHYRNPHVIRVLAHVAYRRKNRDAKPAQIESLIGKTNAADIVASLLQTIMEEVDESPPVSATEPEKSSPPSSVDKSESSGTLSSPSSDEQETIPEPTGTSESDTSSPSAPLSSVA